ncbi:uncharacterized protein PFL1_06518 [Pseudozyma flocculosa PF-1]|uniref:Deoxycytidylate deaminase n=2 Tax=Pseudozyma flocculosa TaxID=84751 RepID=A0A5C3FBD6_9BASI|nr:uncharacterized protein PFL1_06518 [Pseudozyma flocculosa PF-1]EPQ25843.1 hypothetical protein PFL1_06518 [Pseudozyma flocculosa PF-1]SPO40659.1 related to DCD1 - deoxycytidylate deaminase [Pseudozyma flocculosa]
MLISLIGLPGAGKASVSDYLISKHGFTSVHILSSPRSQHLVPELQASSSAPSSSSSSGLPPGPPPPTHVSVDLTPHTGFRSLGFRDARALLEYATANWREDLVTLDLADAEPADRDAFEKRPFFLCIGVEAPATLRWRRWNAKHGKARGGSDMSLEQFVGMDDTLLYGFRGELVNQSRHGDTAVASTTSHHHHHQPDGIVSGQRSPDLARSTSEGPGVLTSTYASLVQPSGLITSISSSSTVSGAADDGGHASTLSHQLSYASLRITNAQPTLSHLYAYLAQLSLSSHHRLRPTWDTYFLSLCTLASLRSNCMKRRVGAVLVRANRVLSTGYNGTPRGLVNCNQGGCPRCNASAACGTQLDECLCLHAEENALLEAGRDRGGAEGTVLYCNTCPCLRCAVKIVQTGVREVVYQLEYSMDGRSRKIFEEAGVVFRRYLPPA